MVVLKRVERIGLNKVYRTPTSSGFQGGVSRVLRAAREAGVKGLNAKKVKSYLADQTGYVRHAPVRKRGYAKIYAPRHVYLFSSDLSDMSALKKANDGVTFLLGVIDVFSKKVWVRPLQTKSAAAVTAAMRDVLKESGSPRHLRTDSGKEYLNRQFQSLMLEHGINHYLAKREPYKAATIERFWRTLKMRLGRWMTDSKTLRYVDILADTVAGYNASVHSTTGKRPIDVTNEKAIADVYARVYGGERANPIAKFAIGDRVHVLKNRRLFRQGYKPLFERWTTTVESVASHHEPIRYRLANKPTVSVYEWELRKPARDYAG